MSSMPIHEELQHLLPAAALGILDDAEFRQVLTHVEQCGDCARLLEEYRETAAQLALLLPEGPMERAQAARLRERLILRAQLAAKTPTSTPSDRLQQLRRHRRLEGRWAGWAVAAALSGVLLMHHAVHRPIDYGWLVAGALTLVLIGVGIYASVQRARAATLRRQLAQATGQPRETTDSFE